MKNTIRSIIPVLSVITLLSACSATDQVSFAQNVKPILDKKCAECHLEGGQGFVKSGFTIEGYHKLMTGTKFGPVIVAGDSLSSTLMALVEGRVDPSIKMPHDRAPLSNQEIKVLKDWIDQGAKNN